MIIIASNYLWIKHFSVSDAHEHTYSFLFIYRSYAPDTLHIHVNPHGPNFVSVNITGSERNPSNHHTTKKTFLPNHIILGLHISTNSKYLNNILFVSLSDVLNTSTIRLSSNIYASVTTFFPITHFIIGYITASFSLCSFTERFSIKFSPILYVGNLSIAI